MQLYILKNICKDQLTMNTGFVFEMNVKFQIF